MKKWILILLGILSMSAHKKSAQPPDNESISTIEITHGFFVVTTSKFTLRRGTEVLVSRVKGRCKVVGFVDFSTILVELPDQTVMPFNKNRITLAPLRKYLLNLGQILFLALVLIILELLVRFQRV